MCHMPCFARPAPSISLSQILAHILSPATTIALLTVFFYHLYLLLYNACTLLSLLKLRFTLNPHRKENFAIKILLLTVLSKTRFSDKSVMENTRQAIPVFSSMDQTHSRLRQLAAHWNHLSIDWGRGEGGNYIASIWSWENLNFPTSLLGSPLKTT